MDNLPQPDQGPGDFAARFTAQQQDSTAQSRQLFSDFRDFFEGISRRMDSLHAAYEAFPGAIGLRNALAPTAVIIKIMGQKSKEGLPGIDQSISTLGNPGPDTSEAANRSMQVNLRTIPDYIKGMRIMHKMLRSTVDIARQRLDNGPTSEKAACAEWVVGAQPIIDALRFETDALQASLTLAKADRQL